MPSISNARLAIQENLPGGNVRADVTCQLIFSQFERFLMANGLRFRLDCKLWGADSGPFNGDDGLFTYPSKFYPDASPTGIESVTFSATMRSSTLNEDDYIGNREDEVYAELSLKNLHDGTKISKKSNEIVHNF